MARRYRRGRGGRGPVKGVLGLVKSKWGWLFAVLAIVLGVKFKDQIKAGISKIPGVGEKLNDAL
jgi:hypothetical protein